jgi:hypothetical protein
VFDLIRCILCVCFAHYTELDVACVFGATNANVYLCAHSLECFSQLVFLFFAYIYLLGGEGYSGPIKKRRTRKKGTGSERTRKRNKEITV